MMCWPPGGPVPFFRSSAHDQVMKRQWSESADRAGKGGRPTGSGRGSSSGQGTTTGTADGEQSEEESQRSTLCFHCKEDLPVAPQFVAYRGQLFGACSICALAFPCLEWLKADRLTGTERLVVQTQLEELYTFLRARNLRIRAAEEADFDLQRNQELAY